MAHGKDTMVRENEREEITVSDGLQLGHTTVDQADVNAVEGEVDKLKQQVCGCTDSTVKPPVYNSHPSEAN